MMKRESDRKCLNHAHAQSFDRCEMNTKTSFEATRHKNHGLLRFVSVALIISWTQSLALQQQPKHTNSSLLIVSQEVELVR